MVDNSLSALASFAWLSRACLHLLLLHGCQLTSRVQLGDARVGPFESSEDRIVCLGNKQELV